MSKRKLPFGYEIRSGVIIKERTEAETVTDIYSLYISGASFGEITDKLLKPSLHQNVSSVLPLTAEFPPMTRSSSPVTKRRKIITWIRL